MSERIHSQDSVSDPRNEDDYDTWEYGTEPLPDDHTWERKSLDAYQRAATYDHMIFGDYDGYAAYRED